MKEKLFFVLLTTGSIELDKGEELVANASIGAIGRPYFDPANDRTKAFITRIHHNIEAVWRTVSSVLMECQGTRLSLRVVVGPELLESDLRSIDFMYQGSCVRCEAIVSMNQSGHRIVYYGWNATSRRTSERYRADENDLLERVSRRKGGNTYSYRGYEVQIDDVWSNEDVQRLVEIYQQTFTSYLVPFTKDSVAVMLESNCVTAVRHKGEIVTVAMGEIAKCEVDGNVICISEISEVATHPDFQSLGLSHFAFGHLLAELVIRDVNVIFMEARAASYGMMAVGWDAGLMPCGRLEQHCVISSPYSEVGQDGKYGDLVVFALPPRR